MYFVSGVKTKVVQPTSTADRMTSLLRVHIHTVLCKLCDSLLQGGDGMREIGGEILAMGEGKVLTDANALPGEECKECEGGSGNGAGTFASFSSVTGGLT